MNHKINIMIIKLIVIVTFAIGNRVQADFTFESLKGLGALVNSWYEEHGPSLSTDGLTLYFASTRPGEFGIGEYDLWVTTREAPDKPWSEPTSLGLTVNSVWRDRAPRISADELSLYFCSNRPGGYGGLDLWVTNRLTKQDDWGEPVNLGSPINTQYDEDRCHISADGLTLLFDSDRPGGQGAWDIWMATRASTSEPWSEPVNIGPPVNGTANDGDPTLSADGRVLFFTSTRPGGYGSNDLWMSQRKTTEQAWGTPVNLGPLVNWGDDDMTSDISADGSTLIFSSYCGLFYGGYELFEVSLVPDVDFNSDGLVNNDDLIVQVDHWGQDEPLCDIGPMPWGDGVVDIEDLKVFIGYWEKARFQNIVKLTEDTFDQIVLDSDMPVLVDFWASWCGPCLTMAPVIEEIADEYAGRVKVCKLNVDYSPDINKRYEITAIPTMILFKDGQIINRWLGVTAKDEITASIDELL
jgi:thioredoxin